MSSGWAGSSGADKLIPKRTEAFGIEEAYFQQNTFTMVSLKVNLTNMLGSTSFYLMMTFVSK